ncbi:MAG TPA: GTP-binding protein [Stellaceae bacterium]|nr:GTP-binding protein [Stellaceae bacterium]
MESVAPNIPAGDIPATVLTGFLGSGKTSLLRRALADPGFTDTAVIVNEIGAIAIDHYLVDFVEGAVLELPGGCLCCAVREDLARTLRDLLDRRDTGGLRPFRRIVIETSGLADPAPILYTLGADPMLDARLSLGRVVTVVDAGNGAATLARFAEAARQAALADVLVISKTDLAPVSRELEVALAALNPDAARVIGQEASDPGRVLFSPHHGPPPQAGEGVETTSSHRRAPSPASGGGSGWGVDAVHSHGIDTFAITLDGETTRLDFARALGALAGAYGSDLLRVKGIVAFSDRGGRPALVQAAQHTMFAPEWLDGWPDDDRRSRLVFVVHEIPRAAILAHFAFASPSVLGSQAARPHVHAE